MKKKIIPLIITICMLLITGCSQPAEKTATTPDKAATEKTPLESLPDDYTLEQAKADGCVTHENGDVTQGREDFDAFYAATQSGESASIRLAFYYTLDDPSAYDEEYYESIKDEYPILFIQDLTYDGNEYTIRWYEDGEEIVETYPYLMKYEGEADSETALYKSYVEYILTNDDTVTREDLLYGLFSSEAEDYIPHMSVCVDMIYE